MNLLTDFHHVFKKYPLIKEIRINVHELTVGSDVPEEFEKELHSAFQRLEILDLQSPYVHYKLLERIAKRIV